MCHCQYHWPWLQQRNDAVNNFLFVSVWLLESCLLMVPIFLPSFFEPSIEYKVPQIGLGGSSLPVSSVSNSVEKHMEESAVWALHKTSLLSMGLDWGRLALPADGIMFCLAWRGASILDPWCQIIQPTLSPVFQILQRTVSFSAEILLLLVWSNPLYGTKHTRTRPHMCVQ